MSSDWRSPTQTGCSAAKPRARTPVAARIVQQRCPTTASHRSHLSSGRSRSSLCSVPPTPASGLIWRAALTAATLSCAVWKYRTLRAPLLRCERSRLDQTSGFGIAAAPIRRSGPRPPRCGTCGRCPRCRAWTPPEDALVDAFLGELEPKAIAQKLNEHFGIQRTATAVIARLKRRNQSRWLHGISLRELERITGVDHRTIVRVWIGRGLLQGERWSGRGPPPGLAIQGASCADVRARTRLSARLPADATGSCLDNPCERRVGGRGVAHGGGPRGLPWCISGGGTPRREKRTHPSSPTARRREARHDLLSGA
jgi:hypothetical protein